MLQDNNNLVRMFKNTIYLTPSDNHKIRTHQTPGSVHARRYNTPTIDEVSIVFLGEEFHPRDNILLHRNI